jgi:hypothetical protein
MQINFSGACKSLTVSLVCVFLCSCGSQDPSEGIVRNAFDALKEKNWVRYKERMITLAEIALSHDKVSPFKRKMGYVGSSVRDEQENRLKKDFDEVSQTDCLKGTSFKSAKLIAKEDLKNPWTEGDCVIPLSTYAIQTDGSLKQGCKLPTFVVTQWHGRFYLLGLQFDQQQESKASN